MRLANLARDWKKASTLKSPTALACIEFRNVKGINDGALKIEPFITGVVGGNGTGKTTLLDLTSFALDQSSRQIPDPLLSRLVGSSIVAKFQVPGELIDGISITISLTGTVVRYVDDRVKNAVNDINVLHIDLANEARVLKELFTIDERRQALLEGSGLRTLDARELAQINWLVQKNYQSVTIREVIPPKVDGEREVDEEVPYFEVVDEYNARYGLENMGAGELCLLVLAWHMRSLRPQTIVLFDELEQSIPPIGQRAIMAILPNLALSKKCQFVLSTHSDSIIEHLPTKWLRLIYKSSGKTSISDSPTNSELMTSLGMLSSTRHFVICEDSAAQHLLQAVLSEHANRLPMIEVLFAGSASRIDQVIDAMPRTSTMQFIGCYDGDQRTQAKSSRIGHKIFLPGNLSPDSALRAAIQLRPDEFTSKLNIPRSRLDVFMTAKSGINDHDWYNLLVEKLGRSIEEILRAYIEIESTDITPFVESIERLISFDDNVRYIQRFNQSPNEGERESPVIRETIAAVRSTLRDATIRVGTEMSALGSQCIMHYSE